MKLVIDPEWDVCHIEVTERERRILDWPPRLSSDELRNEARLALAGPHYKLSVFSNPPEGYKELAEEAWVMARVALPFERENARRRYVHPDAMLYGIPCRVVPG